MHGYSLAPQVFDSILNSLGQGFLLFGRDGMCLPFYSAACKKLFEISPLGRSILEVLRIPEPRQESFTQWYQLLFEDRFDFDDIADLGPRNLEIGNDRSIALEFKPVHSHYGGIDFILVIATDRTAEVNAIRRSEELQVFADMVKAFIRDKAQFRLFVEEGRKLLDSANKLPLSEAEACRNLHTLKAVAGTIKAKPLNELIHSVEMSLRGEFYPELRLKILSEGLTKVTVKFNQLVNELRELTGESAAAREIADETLVAFEQALADGSLPPAELLRVYREQILWTPARSIFAAYNQVLLEAAARLAKKIEPLRFVGENPSLNRAWHEPVWMALPNLFRNVIDHGIEPLSVRIARGKSEAGQVTISIQKRRRGQRSELAVEIADDGNGIDLERLKQQLIRLGRRNVADTGLPSEIMNCIFERGISTNAQVTEASGMGIGLNAVKQAVDQCGGTIEVDSVAGVSTVFKLVLPLPD